MKSRRAEGRSRLRSRLRSRPELRETTVPVNVEVRQRRVATTAVMKNMCVQSA